MTNAWRHPELGKFAFEEFEGWAGRCKLPAFKAFRYRWGGKVGAGKSSFELVFTSDDENSEPSISAARLALKLVSNQEKLLGKVTRALWNDFHGRGPDSGMWWHGDLHTIDWNIKNAFAPRKHSKLELVDDLFKVMDLKNISIAECSYFSDRPFATFHFDAAIDEEHGIGVLTDVSRVIGIGYSADPSPFENSS